MSKKRKNNEAADEVSTSKGVSKRRIQQLVDVLRVVDKRYAQSSHAAMAMPPWQQEEEQIFSAGARKNGTISEFPVKGYPPDLRAVVMAAAMAMRAVQDGTRRLAEVGRRGF